MSILYSKIYEAINAGIQKALILPDETDDDVSVKFRHKAISNDFIPYEYQTVDLGLSVKWCKYNLGAFPGSKPEDWYGNYYAWGEIETKHEYNWDSYSMYNTENHSINKYNNKDKDIFLSYTDDAISMKLDLNMRMPTREECEELLTLDNEWVTDYKNINSLNGIIFTGNNGNTLFIPAAGYYSNADYRQASNFCYLWSNTSHINKEHKAWNFYFNTDKELFVCEENKCFGFNVRGVCPK